ncbi:TPA: hypothetical protein RTH01_001634, partial [Campylobacter jejuni]|nr:hypothetical protein [Campylobacter jejuni]HDZ5084773.1 hypothetical protein [Campylobacter jejuni]HDZ5097842.1 hypothetical protein [Campylobacter jejuni]
KKSSAKAELINKEAKINELANFFSISSPYCAIFAIYLHCIKSYINLNLILEHSLLL